MSTRINWGTVTPIVLFLIVHSMGAIWWASSISATQTSMAETLSGYIAENDSENLRQWLRINQNETNITNTTAQGATTQAILERVEIEIRDLKVELRDQNDLLREILVDGATTAQ